MSDVAGPLRQAAATSRTGRNALLVKCSVTSPMSRPEARPLTRQP